MTFISSTFCVSTPILRLAIRAKGEPSLSPPTSGIERTLNQSDQRTAIKIPRLTNRVNPRGRDNVHRWPSTPTARRSFSLHFLRLSALQRYRLYTAMLLGLSSYPSSKWCSSFSQSLQCPWSSTSSFSGIGAVSFSSAIFNQEVRSHRVP